MLRFKLFLYSFNILSFVKLLNKVLGLYGVRVLFPYSVHSHMEDIMCILRLNVGECSVK